MDKIEKSKTLYKGERHYILQGKSDVVDLEPCTI